MKKKLLLSVLILFQAVLAITAEAAKPRYIWIDAAANFVEFADSKENITRDLQKAYDAGFTDVVVDVRNTMGDVLFNTSVVDQATKLPTWDGGYYHYHERTATWDYLQAFIDAGHHIGLKVHAGINTFVGGRLYSYGLGTQGMVFRDETKRDWVNTLYLDNDGDGTKELVNALDVDTYSEKFLNPANDDVQEFLLDMLKDLAKYDVDGIFLDRCRYIDANSDFSDITKTKFEEYLGSSISDFPACISSTYQKQWWAFRAKVIHDFVVKARETVKSVNSNIQLGTYVGAWYSTYNEVGVNWASPNYDASATYSWANDEWEKYGYADHLDFMLLGAYAGVNDIYGSSEWTCQGFCKLAKEKLMGDVLFAGGPDVGNGTGYENGGQAEAVTKTVDACMNSSDGYFLFDMVHVRKFDYWDAIKDGFAKSGISVPSGGTSEHPDNWTITTKHAGEAFTPTTTYPFANYNGGWLMNPVQTEYRSSSVAKQFAVSNGVIYHIVPGYVVTNSAGEVHQSITATSSYTNGTHSFVTGRGLDSGCAQFYSGHGIASDDNGNIIYANTTNYASKVDSIVVLKNSGKYGDVIDMKTAKGVVSFKYIYKHKLQAPNPDWIGGTGRTDFFYASGNCYDGTGYLWFTDGAEVVRITIQNVSGKQWATKQDVYQITGDGFVAPSDEYRESRIKPYGNDCFLLQNETGVYDCKLVDGEMRVERVIRSSNYKLHAGSIANFNGHKILVLDAIEGGTRDGQLNIYDMNTDDISTATTASIGNYINAMTGTYVSGGTDNNVTFPTEDNTGSALNAKDIANVDTWCEFELDPNGKQLHLYTYCQGVGYAKFTINSEGTAIVNPVTTINASLETSIDNQYQNANITWDASGVTDHSSTQYKVYYRTKPFLSGGEGEEKQVDTENWSSWQELGTTEMGATSFTHVDVKYLNYGTEFYERTYQYKVEPATGITYTTEETMPMVTPVWLTANPIWAPYHGEKDKGVVEYSGYKTVQLFWGHGGEGGKGNRPTSYDVYRDDVKIATTALHSFVDYDVAENKEYTYYIVAHYEGMSDIELKSTTKTVTVGTKDQSKPKYKIDEVYNYRIGNGDGEVKPRSFYSNFTDPYYYRQGVYFRGDWYIAQRANGDGGNGGIIRFYARGKNETYVEDDPAAHPGSDILSENWWQKYEDFSFNSGTNVGIAIDDYGNIFVRYADDEYSNELMQGHVLRAYYSYSVGSNWEVDMTLDNTAQGALLKGHTNYEALTPIAWKTDSVSATPIASIPAYVFDFSSLKFTDLNTGETLTGIPGRCDYYFMEGNVFSNDLKNNNIATEDDGGILYVSPLGSKTIYRVKLNTSAIDGKMEATGLDAYTITETTTEAGKEYPIVGGNYAFKVDGREDYVFNFCENGYFNIGKTQDNLEGKALPIYETYSGMSNAGGCTIRFNGELYMIYPQGYHSSNTGDFNVGIAEREGTEEIDGADLYNLIPIATFNQEDASDVPFPNVNGQWLYAELGLLDGTPLWIGKKFKVTTINEETGEETETVTYLTEENISQYAECIYIHQYVPGIRFAKYRLTIPQIFPQAETRLSVYPIYTDADEQELTREGDGGIEQGAVPEEAIEIDRLDGRFEWNFITYNNSTGVNVYVLEGYHLKITDQYGNKYTHTEGNNKYSIDEIYYYATGDKYTVTYTDALGNVLEKTYTKGTDADFQEYKIELMDEQGNGTGEYIGVLEMSDLYTNNDKIYQARMQVDYKCITGSIKGQHYLSAETFVENDNGYVPMAPAGKAMVYRSLQWGDWDADYDGKPSFDKDGNPVLPDAGDVYWDVYQVAMNVQEPDFTETGRKEPVSYYTIHVAKTNDGTSWIDKFEANDTVKSDYIKDIMLYVGKDKSLDGVAADENGYVDCGAIYGGKIPGTHEFMSKEDETPKDTPDVYWFERYYMGHYEGAAGTEYEIKTPDVVKERKYYVVAHYAAGTPQKVSEVATFATATDGNSKIYAQRHAELKADVTHENLPTGVENIELTANVSAYPIPATISITIKCAEAIENVEIYSLTGVKVKEFAGEGEQIITIAVDDMEAGYYMMHVNNNPPVKILKK